MESSEPVVHYDYFVNVEELLWVSIDDRAARFQQPYLLPMLLNHSTLKKDAAGIVKHSTANEIDSWGFRIARWIVFGAQVAQSMLHPSA